MRSGINFSGNTALHWYTAAHGRSQRHRAFTKITLPQVPRWISGRAGGRLFGSMSVYLLSARPDAVPDSG